MRNFRLLGFLAFSVFFTSAALAQSLAWKVYDDSISQGSGSLQPVTIDRQGNIWVIFLSGTVGRFDGTTWTHYTPADGLPQGKGYAIVSDHSGNVWMSADSGIAEFAGGTWHSYKIQDKLTGIRTYQGLAADSNGNVWVATFSLIFISNVPGGTYDSTWNEFYRFDGNSWTSFTPPYTYNWGGFNAIAFAPDGTLWATGVDAVDTTRNVFTNGLSRYDGVAWQSFNIGEGTGYYAQPVGSSGAMTIVEGTALQPDNGGVWVTLGQSSAGSSDAVYYFNGSSWDTTGLSGSRFTNIWIAQNGDKYFRSNFRNRYGYPADSGALVIVRSNGNLDSIRQSEIPFFPFSFATFASDGTPWFSSPWGDGTSSGVGLETFAAPSSVAPAVASNGGIVCSVYPNPMTSGTAHVSISGAQAGTCSVSLVNALGIVLETASAANGANGCELSTANLPGGAYFIAVQCGTQRVDVPVVKE